MKFTNVIRKLGKFNFIVNEKGHHYFWSRNEKRKNRLIQVINQNGRAIALPLFVDQNGLETVVFHAKTIKSLVDFLEGA